MLYLFPKLWVHIYLNIMCISCIRFRFKFIAQINFLFVICVFRENIEYSETGEIWNWNCLKRLFHKTKILIKTLTIFLNLLFNYNKNWFLHFLLNKFLITFLTQLLINFWCSINPIAENVIRTTIVENGKFLIPLINILFFRFKNYTEESK